jgi:putative exosortase-associated protein (TIGR04073 family)
MLKIILLTCLLLALGSPLRAEDNPKTKLGRGMVNVVTAPLEIVKQTRLYWKKGAQKTPHIIVWMFSGFVKGVVNTVTREVSGMWDIVSFPFAVPSEYKPLVAPDTVFGGAHPIKLLYPDIESIEAL